MGLLDFIIPGASMVTGALGSLFGNKGKNTVSDPRYYSPDELGIPKGSPMHSYLSTGIIPGSDQDRVTRTSGSNWSETNTDSSSSMWQQSTPTYHYGSQSLVDMLPALMRGQMAQGGKISAAEKMGVINQLSRHSEQLKRGLESSARERGLGLSEPISTQIDASVGGAKMSALADYLTRIPQMERSRYNEDLGNVGSILANLFKGTSIKGGSSSRSTSRTTGGMSSRTVQEGQKGGVFDPSAVGYTVRQTQGGGKPNFFDILGMAGATGAGLYGAWNNRNG